MQKTVLQFASSSGVDQRFMIIPVVLQLDHIIVLLRFVVV